MSDELADCSRRGRKKKQRIKKKKAENKTEIEKLK